MSCGRITIGSGTNCDELPEGGTRSRLILLNYNDVQRIYENSLGVITSFDLLPGKRAYEFLGFRTDVKKSEEVTKTVLKNRFRHNVGFAIYENDQIQKNNIRKIVKGRFIAIIENLGKDENSIEVVGKNAGLKIVGGVIRDAYENGGLFIINLATPENGAEFERKLPQNLGFSYEEALTIIDGLLNPDLQMTFDITTQFPFDSDILYSFDEQ